MRKITVASFVHDGLLHFRLVEYDSSIFPLKLVIGGEECMVDDYNVFWPRVCAFIKAFKPKQEELFKNPDLVQDVEIFKIMKDANTSN